MCCSVARNNCRCRNLGYLEYPFFTVNQRSILNPIEVHIIVPSKAQLDLFKTLFLFATIVCKRRTS